MMAKKWLASNKLVAKHYLKANFNERLFKAKSSKMVAKI